MVLLVDADCLGHAVVEHLCPLADDLPGFVDGILRSTDLDFHTPARVLHIPRAGHVDLSACLESQVVQLLAAGSNERRKLALRNRDGRDVGRLDEVLVIVHDFLACLVCTLRRTPDGHLFRAQSRTSRSARLTLSNRLSIR